MTASRLTRRLARPLAAAMLALSAAACSGTLEGAREGIGFREARFNEMSAIKSWRACRDEGLDLDRQARQGASPGRYLASAKVLEKCEAELGAETAGIAQEERMRAYALAIQNYLKGGDLAAARSRFAAYRAAFGERDLYFADGSSFSASMDVLLGLKNRAAVTDYALLNVSDTLQAELRRLQYWKQR